jgi:signal transduction histidine kinase
MLGTSYQSDDFMALSRVAQVFLGSALSPRLVQLVVDQALVEISKLSGKYHAAVLALLIENGSTGSYLQRHSVSFVEGGKNVEAEIMTQADFKKIITPLTATSNLCVQAMDRQHHFITHNYEDILSPPLSKLECRRLQAKNKVKTSVVFPIILEGKSIGNIIFSTRRSVSYVTAKQVKFIENMCGFIAIAINNNRMFRQIESDKHRLERANLKLKEMDKLKDEFVSVASHELRTPMTAIRNSVFMAQREKEVGQNARLKRFLEISYNSTERLIKLINSMLNISRMESGKENFIFAEIDLLRVVKQVQQELASIAQDKGIVLELVAKDKEYLVDGDPEKLLVLVTNLVGNALKFTKVGGVTLELVQEEELVYLAVRDTGVGIKKEDFKKLFTEFARLETSYVKIKETGTGLGLNIAQKIARRHRGKVTVQSEFGKGSVFTLRLPKAGTTNLSEAREEG